MVQISKRLLESKEILLKIASGINPLDDTPIHDESFLHNPQVIRPLFFLADYLTNEMQKSNRTIPTRRPNKFTISDKQLESVALPSGSIGIYDFAQSINASLAPSISKKITGAMIYKKLKEMGILSEEVNNQGYRTTVTNEKSEGYGMKV